MTPPARLATGIRYPLKRLPLDQGIVGFVSIGSLYGVSPDTARRTSMKVYPTTVVAGSVDNTRHIIREQVSSQPTER